MAIQANDIQTKHRRKDILSQIIAVVFGLVWFSVPFTERPP